MDPALDLVDQGLVILVVDSVAAGLAAHLVEGMLFCIIVLFNNKNKFDK